VHDDSAHRENNSATAVEDNIRMDIDLGWIVGVLPGVVWSALPDGVIDFLNDGWREYTGRDLGQSLDAGWQAAIHPEDLPLWLASWRSVAASAKPWELELRLRRLDGAYRWFLFRARPLVDAGGRIAHWCGIGSDIDDQRRAEDGLRRSEAFFLQVQQLSLTGGWRFDVAADIVESSPVIQRVYDPQPGEDISKPPFWFDRIHPEDRPRVQAEFDRCLRENTDYQAGYRIVLPDGTIRYQYATGHPRVNDAGALVEFIGASMDMTEHWRATNELARASEALRELQRTMSRAAQIATIGEFAASMAHEVNQPLSGIITNASTGLRMLDASPPNVDGARETVMRTLRDGNRASDVISRLRALFSRKELTLESMDLNDAMREVIALLSTELQKNRIILDSELADELPAVAGDRIQLQQVILNLLRNAIDAMAEVHGRQRRLLVRSERESGERVRVIVRDAGVGVDPESVNKLFDAFYTTKREGMGVGLSVSRSIIESHQGRIWAAPNEDHGATFAFSLPSEPMHVVRDGVGRELPSPTQGSRVSRS
jgi:signal transduction histidine kinase